MPLFIHHLHTSRSPERWPDLENPASRYKYRSESYDSLDSVMNLYLQIPDAPTPRVEIENDDDEVVVEEVEVEEEEDDDEDDDEDALQSREQKVTKCPLSLPIAREIDAETKTRGFRLQLLLKRESETSTSKRKRKKKKKKSVRFSEPPLLLLPRIPMGWERVVRSEEKRVLVEEGEEVQEWRSLQRGGGWWVGNMTWL